MSAFVDPASSLPQENKMAEEQLDMEYISLHGHIKNTPLDTEVHENRQEYLTSGKDFIEHKFL